MIDTQEQTILADLGAGPRAEIRRPSATRRYWGVPLAVVGLLLIAIVLLAGVIPAEVAADKFNPRVDEIQGTPYARTPAAAQPVGDRVVFGDLEGKATRYDTDRDIYFVTVTEPRQTLLGWFFGRGRPEIEWLTREDKFGVNTEEQEREISLQFMRTSEQVAQYVALTRLGYEAEILPGDVVVAQLVCLESNDAGCLRYSPADAVLDVGDTLIEVDGAAVATVDDLTAVLQRHEPGDQIPVRLSRPGSGELDVEVELIASPSEPDRTIIGFVPFDTSTVELPFEVDIRTGGIGGPSAGLAFTLDLIDELSPGRLTGGRKIAVTGAINLDGTVGAIGGLPQKASAVRQTGVDVFLVPSSQSAGDIERAREAGGGDVEIITVGSLDEALEALEALGGDPVPATP